jgi:hypothetical protein
MSIWTRTGGSLGISDQLAKQQGSAADSTQQLGNPFWSSGSTITTTDYAKMMEDFLKIYGAPLTNEESKELEKLEAEFKIEIKNAKLKVFKSLSPELRQFAINSHEWERARLDIDGADANRSDRHNELLKKRSNGLGGGFPYSGLSGSTLDSSMFYPPQSAPVQLPSDITIDELKEAHIEASLEEEVLNEQV